MLGGIDSSLIASLSRSKKINEDFKIFNGRFRDSEEFDESQYAKDLSHKNSMNLYLTDINSNDFVNNIEKIIWHLDQPIAGPGSFPQYMVSKNVKKHVKVVLGGQGGDEIFGGYARYMICYLEYILNQSLSDSFNPKDIEIKLDVLLNNLNGLKNYKNFIKSYFSKNFFADKSERYFDIINRGENLNGIIFPKYIDRKNNLQDFQAIFNDVNNQNIDYFTMMTNFDLKTLLPALLQVEDRMSMAHGVESRVPLLDHKIIEFVSTIPTKLKFKDGNLKFLLKDYRKLFTQKNIKKKRQNGFSSSFK